MWAAYLQMHPRLGINFSSPPIFSCWTIVYVKAVGLDGQEGDVEAEVTQDTEAVIAGAHHVIVGHHRLHGSLLVLPPHRADAHGSLINQQTGEKFLHHQ